MIIRNDAKKLVYATGGEHKPELPAMSELALVGGAPGAKVSVTFLNEAAGRQDLLSSIGSG